MSKIGKMAAGILYGSLLKQFPEAHFLPEGEGIMLKFQDGSETHLNVQSQSGGQTKAVLSFFSKAKGSLNEEACYGVEIDRSEKTLQAKAIREETETPLSRRLSGRGKPQLQQRVRIAPSGGGETAELLYAQILAFAPELGNETLKLSARQGRGAKAPRISVLSNLGGEMGIEFSNLGLEGFYGMDVSLDKTRKTASVAAVSGAFGRIPSYLAYPDGKEMPPHEREKFGLILLERLGAVQAQRAGDLTSRFA